MSPNPDPLRAPGTDDAPRYLALELAARAIWDRCGDQWWDPDDLDPESSLTLRVPMRARDAAALRDALVALDEHEENPR